MFLSASYNIYIHSGLVLIDFFFFSHVGHFFPVCVSGDFLLDGRQFYVVQCWSLIFFL